MSGAVQRRHQQLTAIASDEIAFDIDALQHSSGSTQSLGFQLGDGTIATSGYTGVAGAGGVSTGMWLTASGIGNTAAAMISGSIRCISADRKTWQENSIVGYTNNNSQNQSNARKTLTNALTTLRLTNSGAANFTAGTLSLKLY